MAPELFKAIDRDDSLATRVAREIERLIVDERLPPGHRMLSERELGEQFGVSRTVIREAVRALSAKGFLNVKTGDGTYVLNHNGASAAMALERLLRLTGVRTPGQARTVYEVRRPLEIAIAGLAAERASSQDIETLRGCINQARRTDLEERAYVDADVRFHLALAQATQNHLFVALLNSVSDLMNAIRELGVAVEASREDGVRQHEKILGCIVARDVEGCRRAMRAHMDEAEKILVDAISTAPQVRVEAMP